MKIIIVRSDNLPFSSCPKMKQLVEKHKDAGDYFAYIENVNRESALQLENLNDEYGPYSRNLWQQSPKEAAYLSQTGRLTGNYTRDLKHCISACIVDKQTGAFSIVDPDNVRYFLGGFFYEEPIKEIIENVLKEKFDVEYRLLVRRAVAHPFQPGAEPERLFAGANEQKPGADQQPARRPSRQGLVG